MAKLSQICPKSHRTYELSFIATTTAEYFSTSNPTSSLPQFFICILKSIYLIKIILTKYKVRNLMMLTMMVNGIPLIDK
ncbi:MAG: hypothetical protein M3250_03590 [Thermoproteota archaeon]|nr:hypothetical protein [Thermoproteota archaeon]